MSQICYAAYNEDFIALADGIFKKLGKDVDILVYDPENPRALLKRGCRVVLARGGTAMKIRRALDVPVVDIPIPFEDMIRALTDAARIGGRIGVVGFTNLMKGLDSLNPLLNVSITQVFAGDERETRELMRRLKADGVEVFVGGKLQARIARELGMNHVRIDFSEKALEHACAEAEALLAAMAREARENEELNAVLNTTREGFVAVDTAGDVTLINRTAAGFLRNANDPTGLRLTDVFPEFDDLPEVLRTGKEKLQEVANLNGTSVLYNIIPLRHFDDEIIGAVITFNDTRTITMGERKIRDRILSKGLYAVYRFADIKGTSRSIRACVDTAKVFSAAPSTVLISGETGSGKELFAQSIHNESPRRGGPFVAVNCASLPESILESELFGYEEGAFTGAKKSGKPGLFELAHGGTLFLDEIGEMPFTLQGRLLRVLEDKKVMRLGGDGFIPVDVRIIAATNKKLADLVKENKFRADLFFRLNVLTLLVPPLRERPEDIGCLVRELRPNPATMKEPAFTEDAVAVLERYAWPGNVRQLRNFLEKIAIVERDRVMDAPTVREMLCSYEPCTDQADGEDQSGPRPSVSRSAVEDALRRAAGNRSRAADILKIHRSTLWRLLRKHGGFP